ncbi:MAG: DNA repair protein RadC [candidate division NC10 bacterium]|nr:DNA repair protein RadC [candidate division NC10 bacterium]
MVKRGSMRDIPEVDRPREKLAKRGPTALSNTELLAIILGSGTKGENVLQVAEGLLKKYGGKSLPQIDLEELMQNKGLGKARACQLLACFELGRRLLVKQEEEFVIRSPEDVYEATKDTLRGAKKEHFLALYLNARNQLIKKETISIGSLNANIVHPREVFHPAVGEAAASVILVHNHPSGDTEPSKDDIALTRRLVEAGRIMGIEVLDHIIVGNKKFSSLKDRGII